MGLCIRDIQLYITPIFLVLLYFHRGIFNLAARFNDFITFLKSFCRSTNFLQRYQILRKRMRTKSRVKFLGEQ